MPAGTDTMQEASATSSDTVATPTRVTTTKNQAEILNKSEHNTHTYVANSYSYQSLKITVGHWTNLSKSNLVGQIVLYISNGETNDTL